MRYKQKNQYFLFADLHRIMCLMLILFGLTYSAMGQTSAKRTNILILKDGQEISVDSVKINRSECDLSFLVPGNWMRQNVCIGYVHFYYDATGFMRSFDERPCACEKINYVTPKVIETPKSTRDIIIKNNGDNLIADAGSIIVDTKKLIINYLQNKKKQKVKYCETKEIHFATGKTEKIDDTFCKPKK
jgi:hypothetical protein